MKQLISFPKVSFVAVFSFYMFVTSSRITLKTQTQNLYKGALLLQNDPLYWVSFSVDPPFSSFSLLWTFQLFSLHWAWSGLTQSLCPLPEHTVMMWAQVSRQVTSWAHIPGGMGPILGTSITLEILGCPRNLFLQGRTLWFCLLGEQPVQGPAVWTGWGKCPGARAAAAPGTASVLGDHVTPTCGLYYSRWPWAPGISADFWDVLDSDHLFTHLWCPVHPSTHAHLHPQPVSVICRWDNFPLSFTPMGVFSRLLGGHSVGFPEG